MRRDDPPADRESKDAENRASIVQGLLSLAIFIYLFVQAVLMFNPIGQSYASTIHDNLMGVLMPMAQPLCLEVRGMNTRLYGGNQQDYEHFFRVVVTDESGNSQTYQVPGEQLGSGWRDTHRYQRLAEIVASHAEANIDDIPAVIARGIGAYFVRVSGGGKASVACIRRNPQPLDLQIDGQSFPADPRDPSYENEIYRAMVFPDEGGAFQVVKEMAAEHVAPLTEENGK